MDLWIESAYQSPVEGSVPETGMVGYDVVRTLQTEERFCAIMASGDGRPEGEQPAAAIADRIATTLAEGVSLDGLFHEIVDGLPPDERVPLTVLEVLGGREAHVAEIDTLPLFMSRRGQVILLPVVEEEVDHHLVRRCHFSLQEGDYLAVISPRYLVPKKQRWRWARIAQAVKRWTDTHCDAVELLGALERTHRRLHPEQPPRSLGIIAMRVRATRTATVWTGPPGDPGMDQEVLNELMAEPGTRIICGDTTAQIAARLLGVEVDIEPRPEDDGNGSHPWDVVPPTATVEGIDLVTEGRVTLGETRKRLAEMERTGHLPRSDDGATRLARALLKSDKIRFMVGLALNPLQTDRSGATSPRRIVIEGLMGDLQAQGKVTHAEYF